MFIFLIVIIVSITGFGFVRLILGSIKLELRKVEMITDCFIQPIVGFSFVAVSSNFVNFEFRPKVKRIVHFEILVRCFVIREIELSD